MKKIAIATIKAYQKFVSPVLGPTCRFHPTCSSYAMTAIETHGLAAGLFLAFKRVFRCNPWGGSGVDEVPKKGKWTQ